MGADLFSGELFAQQKQAYDVHAAWLDKWLNAAGALVAGSVAFTYFAYAQMQIANASIFQQYVSLVSLIAGGFTLLIAVLLYGSLLIEYRENAKRLMGTFTANEKFLIGSSGKFKYVSLGLYCAALLVAAFFVWYYRNV